MTTDIWKEVSAEDYAALEDKFKTTLKELQPFMMGNPGIEQPLMDFIVEVGVDVKKLLQMYGQQDHIKSLEVEDFKQQMLVLKRLDVKRELAFTEVKNAMRKFTNLKGSP